MLQDESIVTLSEAARSLPRVNGKSPHASTIWRWARKGLSGIHLETRRIGGRFVTSIEALERFTTALAEIPLKGRGTSLAPPARPRTELQRERAIQRANAELKAAGI